MILAARRLKVIDQDECSKTNKKDEAKGKTDTERQKVGAGMHSHERDEVEGRHFHETAREDADDAKEVHGHGKAGGQDGVEQKESGIGEHKEKLERLGDAADHRGDDGGQKDDLKAGAAFGFGGEIECCRDGGKAKELAPAGGGKTCPGRKFI